MVLRTGQASARTAPHCLLGAGEGSARRSRRGHPAHARRRRPSVPRGTRLLASLGVPTTGVLVQTLLDRGTDADVAEAQAAIERLAAAPADEGLVIRDIWLLRLRALLARTRGDDAVYRDLVSRYRAMAESLGFEGHIAWAEAMVADEE